MDFCFFSESRHLHEVAGHDTYLYVRGDGWDTVYDYAPTLRSTDTIIFKQGVLPQDVKVNRLKDDLVLSLQGTTDELKVSNYFAQDATNGWQVEQVWFTDAKNVIWVIDDIRQAIWLAKMTAGVYSRVIQPPPVNRTGKVSRVQDGL